MWPDPSCMIQGIIMVCAVHPASITVACLSNAALCLFVVHVLRPWGKAQLDSGHHTIIVFSVTFVALFIRRCKPLVLCKTNVLEFIQLNYLKSIIIVKPFIVISVLFRLQSY